MSDEGAAQLAAALGGELPAAVAARLTDDPLLRARLVDVLAGRIRWGAPDDDLSTLLDLGDEAAAEMPLRVGCAWHAASVLRVLDGTAIRHLTGRLGFDPRPVALRHGPRHLVPVVSSTELQGRIETDGAACLGAWYAQINDLGSVYGRLRVPANLPDASHLIYGPPLVRALLAVMRAE